MKGKDSLRQLVLLGIGHTNAHVLHEWAEHPIPNCELICISPFASATYSGMLPGTLGNQFSDSEMRIDLRRLTDAAGAKLIVDTASKIDIQNQSILFPDSSSVSYDALSIGIGSVPAGYAQHQSSPILVPTKPMQTFLQRLEERTSQSNSNAKGALRCVIVGGGVASVEIALCFQQRWNSQSAPARPIEIQIFTASERIANGMKSSAIAKLEKILASRQIQIHTSKRIVEVSDHSTQTADGQEQAADVVIWATGAAASQWLADLPLEHDQKGFIATRKTLQSLTKPNIFAVGDSGTIIESPSPKAGVYAVRQSPILWHNLQAFFDGGPMRDFEPQGDFLKILNTGDQKALLAYRGWSVHAKWCWHLKKWIDKGFIQDYQIPPT